MPCFQFIVHSMVREVLSRGATHRLRVRLAMAEVIKQKTNLNNLFKTILHELMTGQRRVNEINFENEKGDLLPDLSRVEGMAAEPEIKYNKEQK